jgi:N-acetylglucosamine-6-phosphate deacetylase
MLEAFGKHKDKYQDTTLVGVFLEGPWLSPSQCGAQAVSCMKTPCGDEIKKLKEKYPYILRVGAAPELENGMEFGRACIDLGIIASVAHTNAVFSDIEEAVNNGYTVMTHLYSGMKGTERVNAYRIAGAIEAGLFFDELYAEIIADGKHLPPELLRFIYKCKGADRICLVTDACRAAGMPDGSTTRGIGRADSDAIIIEDGVAKMPDRKAFAGSASSYDRLYRTMAGAIGHDLIALSKMASLTPARVMGLTDRGEIAVGKRADMLIIDSKMNIKKIIFGGNEI